MPYYRKNSNHSRQQSSQEPSQTTEFFKAPDQALEYYTSFQTSRVVASFRAQKYEVDRVGVRKTKNPDVVMWRAYVKINASHDKRTQKANAANLVRAVFAGVGEISFYQPEFDALDMVCVVWFAFDSKPFVPRQ